LERRRDHRRIEEVIGIPRGERKQVGEVRFPACINNREEVPKDFRNLPGGPEFSDEVRSVADNGERVRSSGLDRGLFTR
jgi:hypothetical protein